jgi:transcriptional regulator with XRE-family HTH domain
LLRELRNERALPLRVVAAAASIDSTLLSKIELNQRVPTEEQTGALAKFFGARVEEFQARRIATKFWQDHGRSAATGKAVLLLHEEAGQYGGRKPRKKSS